MIDITRSGAVRAAFAVSLLAGLAHGQVSFTLTQVFSLGGIKPKDSAVLDYNEDGYDDVIVGEGGNGLDQPEGDLSVLFGDGTAHFPDGDNSGVAVVTHLTTGDFNEDGHDDIVWTSDPGGVLSFGLVGVVLGDGSGGFPSFPDWSMPIPDPLDIATGDFDEDGHLDLVIGSFSGNLALFARGNGDGSFNTPVAMPDSLSNGIAREVAVGDLNGDGHLDATVGGSGIYLGDGMGGFTNVGYASGGILVDMNGDGVLDTVTSSSDQVFVGLGVGDGTFVNLPSVQLPLSASHAPPSDRVVADFNGDGLPDVAALNGDFTQSGPVILLNQGGGVLSVALFVNIGNDMATNLSALDADADGLTDLVVHQWSPFSSQSWVYRNTTMPPTCPADLTGSSNPNNPGYGVPDGIVDASDFFYYLDQFAAGNLAAADLTGSSDPNSPSYGVPDGTLDASDFFFYLTLFGAGCP